MKYYRCLSCENYCRVSVEEAPPEQCILRGGDCGHPAVWEQAKKEKAKKEK